MVAIQVVEEPCIGLRRVGRSTVVGLIDAICVCS